MLVLGNTNNDYSKTQYQIWLTDRHYELIKALIYKHWSNVCMAVLFHDMYTLIEAHQDGDISYYPIIYVGCGYIIWSIYTTIIIK